MIEISLLSIKNQAFARKFSSKEKSEKISNFNKF